MSVKYSSTDRVLSIDELCSYYAECAEENADLKVGIEWERFGIDAESLDVIAYGGDNGYQAVMKFLHEKKGWHIEDGEDEWIYTLQRSNARIPTEGDGRPEITSAPFPSLHVVAREIQYHMEEIEHFSREAGICWLPVGYHPFASVKDIPIIPKKRYQVIDQVFPQNQQWIEQYMRMLCGTHLNFGYTSEENLLRKIKVLIRVSPIVTALFASSPFEQGRQSTYLCLRRYKNFQGAPEHVRMMPNILQEDVSLKTILSWYADNQVIYFPHDPEQPVPANFSFLQWMHKGHAGRYPTFADFDQHIKIHWSDVRLRPSYLEYRVFDSVPFPFLMAAAALVKGLIFDRRGWQSVEKCTKNWTQEDIAQAHRDLCTQGLQTQVRGTSLLEVARKLFFVASENLFYFDRQNEEGQDERIFLQPIERLLKKGICVAEDILEYTNGDAKKLGEWVEQYS